jgi:hypothetical protein
MQSEPQNNSKHPIVILKSQGVIEESGGREKYDFRSP